MKKIIVFYIMCLFALNLYSKNTITVYQKGSLMWTDDVIDTNIYKVDINEKVKFENQIKPHIEHAIIGIMATMFTDSRRVLIFVKKMDGVDYNEFANYFLKWMTGGLGEIVFIPYGVIVIDEKELDKDPSYGKIIYDVLGCKYIKK